MADNLRMDIAALIKLAGGIIPLAKAAGVSRTTIYDWKRAGTLPGGRVPRISRKLRIPVETLIPLIQEPEDAHVCPKRPAA
jgi:hypothetical protein